MKRRYKLIAVLALAALGSGVVLETRESEPVAQVNPAASADVASTEPKTVELADVELTELQPQTLSEEIRISGSLEPVRSTSLNSKIAGTLEAVNVDVGDAVKAGQVLARFDTSTIEMTLEERSASLQALQAQLSLAQSTLTRTKQLQGSGITGKANLDEAQSQVQQLEAQLRGAQAQIDQAKRDLDDATVTAKFDGVISERSVDPGQTVGQNTALFGLVDISELDVDAGVPTTRVSQVEVGQTARLTVDGVSGREITATVKRISPVAEANTRTVHVFLSIDNAAGDLRGGMFAIGSITVRQSKDTVAVPVAALRQDGATQFVLKTQGGRLVRQDVTVGARWDDGALVEISDGLAGGDRIVSAPLPDLKPQTPIRITRS
ncbi:efflux RND transporter periplasmic adaptor subunit [Aurantimonas sp. MSK8Z-1]|uniref:efflux RND transporter periplasmic adaptor subunit n=1 Tax=Mangrovibrevibacter kandeliae TaxID=2968473 RepID=UPI0021174D62|nr:efflux RND transporter periplasmic adaptor subunit [Aurantimonas sp. MSK8Z-1]MCW4116810.1 efflux RND transporter periplasmic adaptor subunit [Aurantimonas sp. MSK8Z-1]